VSIEFLITSLIVVATPGTGVLYTLAAGLSRGMPASAPSCVPVALQRVTTVVPVAIVSSTLQWASEKAAW
jgi:threonine/homoserine/homoserine lactone efflux protein